MNVSLVAGGCGFIGSNLIDYLIYKGHTIICIDNLLTGNLNNIKKHIDSEKLFFYNVDIIDNENLCKVIKNHSTITHIWNLACAASPEKYMIDGVHTINTSIIGTTNLLNIAVKHQAKFLFTSTSEIYGDPLIKIQDESYWGNVNPYGPRSCYDESKRCTESLIYEYKKKYPELKEKFKIVRLFNTYGPRMDINDGRVITNFIKNILNDKPINIYGNGTQYRCFCYIDDLVHGLFLLMNSNYHKPINMGNPNEKYTMNELKDLISVVLQKNIHSEYSGLPKDDPKIRQPDITLAKEVLGWKPKITLKDGFMKTYNYFVNLQNNN